MNIYHFIYAALPMLAAPIAIPVMWCHAKGDLQKRSILKQRLGVAEAHCAQTFKGSPKIWLHAVSVGEVKAAELIVEALAKIHPGVGFLITTTTATGQHEANQRLGGRASVCYAPLDLWPSVARFLSVFRPDVLICMETEIWPNWIVKARRLGMAVIFLNGRLSSRSIRAYMKVRPLLKPVLAQVAAFSMISDVDARRIQALGAESSHIHVNGNVKFDIRIDEQSEATAHRSMQLFGVDDTTPVFIAGSIRSGEMEPLLDVCQRLIRIFPRLLFVMAPRHIEKAPMLERMAKERGIDCQRRTQLNAPGERTAALVVLDTIGELRDLYSIAWVAFCGASLIPLGGHNILEAAAHAKPVLFGPHMDDFKEARVLLEKSGGGICVADADELVRRAADLLGHPAKAKRLGKLARNALIANQGAAKRHAQVVSKVLSACEGPDMRG